MSFNAKAYFSYDDDLLRRVMFLVLLAIPVLLLIGRSAGDIAVSIIAVSFLIHSFYWRDFSWLESRWVQVALLFWCFIVLNSMHAYDVKLALARAVPFIRFPIFAIAVSYWLIRQKRDLSLFVFVFVATLVFAIADGLFEYAFGYDFAGNERIPGRLSGPFEVSTLGIYLTKMGIPMVIALLGVLPVLGKREILKVFLLFSVMAITILLAGERMALLLLFFALAIMVLVFSKYRKWLFGLGLVLVIGLGGALYFDRDLNERVYETTTNQFKEDPKLSNAYKAQIFAAWEIIQDHPILGVGSNNYRFVCKMPDYDVHADADGKFSRCLIHPHQVYLELWVNNGLVGVGLFLAMVFCWLKLFLTYRPDREPDYLLFAGCLGALLFLWPLSVGMSIFSNFNGVSFWTMIAFMLAGFQLKVQQPYGPRLKGPIQSG